MRVLSLTRKKLEGVVGTATLGVQGHVNNLIEVFELARIDSYPNTCYRKPEVWTTSAGCLRAGSHGCEGSDRMNAAGAFLLML